MLTNKNKKIVSNYIENDIDVTPIMNMFIILIPFLVSMAVFTHFSIIYFNLPSDLKSASKNQSNEKPKLKLTTVLKKDYLLVTYGETIFDSIPVNNITFNSKQLKLSLEQAKDTTEFKDEMILAIDDSVKIELIVKIMDLIKDAGFSKLNVSGSF